MNKDISLARRCFEENLQLFADSQSEPEKFNLYNGLASLADGIEKLKQEVERILYILETKRA